MAQFKVTAATLTQQASALNDLNGRFKTAIESFVNAEASLNGMWDGEANDAFHAAFFNDKGQMDAFYNLILEYIQQLNTIATRYSQTEAANTQIASDRTYH